ncbi:hypothetical protein C0Z18_23305 [Trinickia dabaoshanensis]|uniref:Uncharacterized protein n=1 Tax=Trinickia dabaoshanensis TaxID=564714 RepID=A0A2N7VH65_9BURK|nr:hypothetical protein C0Z18_23305 [Trinickia dabaoshanensis]
MIATRPRTANCCASTQVAALGDKPARIDRATRRIDSADLVRVPRKVSTIDTLRVARRFGSRGTNDNVTRYRRRKPPSRSRYPPSAPKRGAHVPIDENLAARASNAVLPC